MLTNVGFVQTLVGFTQLYRSLDADQVSLLDELLKGSLADVLELATSVPSEVIQVMREDSPLDEKVVKVLTDPNARSKLSAMVMEDEDEDVFVTECPGCKLVFAKESQNG